jgi:hypothetical protein
MPNIDGAGGCRGTKARDPLIGVEGSGGSVSARLERDNLGKKPEPALDCRVPTYDIRS